LSAFEEPSLDEAPSIIAASFPAGEAEDPTDELPAAALACSDPETPEFPFPPELPASA